jgi:fructuronate reductase
MSNQILAKTRNTSINLCDGNLLSLPSNVERPSYDRTKIAAGIVHLSLGAFHRAHEAVYTDDVLAKQAGDWGICGIGVLASDQLLCERMMQQDMLYSVLSRNANTQKLRIVGSIKEVMLAPSATLVVINRIADQSIKILSLTITEKGYCHDPVTGQLDVNHPFIKHDIVHLEESKSAIGLIVAGLQERMRRHGRPLTLLSCDNLPGNGHKTKDIVCSFARLVDDKLAVWIEANITFPNTMVDRITPVTTQNDIEAISQDFGIDDACPVVCEEFRQWVLEDKFIAGRPAWELAGAQFVSDVYPYELAKIRLLNVSHSIFAYPAFLAGYEFVSDGARDHILARFVRKVMDQEITPTLPPVPGLDLDKYKTTVIERFANPAIKDRWERICSDGSHKLANQLLPIVRERIAAGKSYGGLAVATAAWIRYLLGNYANGQPYVVQDPMAEKLQTLAQSGGKNPTSILAVQKIFGDDLCMNQDFVKQVGTALEKFYHQKPQEVLEQFI